MWGNTCNELVERTDEEIFFYSRKLNHFILTKDPDFLELVEKQNAPPMIILVGYGNVGKTRLKLLLHELFEQVVAELNANKEMNFIIIK